MPDEISQILRRLDMSERNHTDLAKSMTELVGGLRETREDVAQIRLNEAVAAERDKARDEWRVRIEAGQKAIYKLGWWVLGTFGSMVIALVTALVKGVFSVQ